MADKPSRGPFLRQTLISLTIVAISFCAGLIEAGGQEQLLKISESEESDVIFKELVDWRNLCQNTVPFVGVTLLIIIAEFGGRKPAVAIIITLTITASSLSIPETKLCLELPAVVVTIMSLFFLSGITTAVEDVMLKTIRLPGVLSLWSKYDDNVYSGSFRSVSMEV
ncbi:hypothetical protein MSG28_012643 [Choristoneura fumiferana]|uniref:Uncharacterized protein n=1 Tax=Choristoneura fumiferana TaxID=7141 RepID=A0ACC0JHB9_CHOFU|nr:hypothetical protein MSG28_012643 [Choristoneura fumiferana]